MRKNTKNPITKTSEISNNTQSDLFNLGFISKKSLNLSFTAQKTSSDGGLLLVKSVEDHIKIIKSVSNCINDNRNASYVTHSIESMIAQRVYQIAAGYEDANDCDTLRDDSIIKICSGRLPESENALASQPTICRLENILSAKELHSIGQVFINHFISSYQSEPSVIILDCDDTNSNAHGHQQEIEYNDYYGEYCYMPLHIYEGLSGKLITTILRPGRRNKTANISKILRKIITYLRKIWKNTKIVVRGDGHFCCKEFMDWTFLEKKTNFITGLASNAVLNKLADTTIKSAEREYNQYKKPVKRYHSFEYQASTWQNSQRVIVKVEVNTKGTNVRYIVTDLREFKTKELYEKGYCARGNMELRIKDHKTYLQSDRMSCNSFLANQFRLFLHSAAYVLIHALQKQILIGTEFQNATMKTIQLKIIKVAANVKEMKTKIHIELPAVFPLKSIFEKSLGIFEILRC